MPDQPEGVTEDLIKELAKNAHDLDAIRKCVEDVALVSGTLWFSYLFACSLREILARNTRMPIGRRRRLLLPGPTLCSQQ